MIAVFAAIHGLYYSLGVRFDERPLDSFWQYLDPALLRVDLLRSLFYLHSQPPLFNLFLGVVLKLFPEGHALAFEAAFLAAGLVFYLAFYALMWRLGLARRTAFLLASLFIASPGFVLHEQCLFYALPVAALLTLSALSLEAFLRTGRFAAGLGFFGLLLLLAGTWGLFHLAFMVYVALGLALAVPRLRRRTLLAAAVPVLLLSALYAKNLALFGHFAPSTWVGMNLARISVRRIPSERREQMIADGTLSPVSGVRPFAPLSAYPREFGAPGRYRHVPSLSLVRKSTGHYNLNHIGYVRISEAYLRDSLAALRNEPRRYLNGLATAWLDYFDAASHSDFLLPNRERAMPLVVSEELLSGRWPRPLVEFKHGSYHAHVLLLIGLPAVFAFGVRAALQRGASLERRGLLLYVCFAIGWVALLGNSLEVGENNRFRFTTDPFSLALAGLLLERLAAHGPVGGRGPRAIVGAWLASSRR